MTFWILMKDVEAYNKLCSQSGIAPVILDESYDKIQVEMTSDMINTWVNAGYWFG